MPKPWPTGLCLAARGATGWLGIPLSVVHTRLSRERAHKSGCGHLSKRLDAPVVIGSVVTDRTFLDRELKTLGVPD